jgi:hypothetical protein
MYPGSNFDYLLSTMLVRNIADPDISADASRMVSTTQRQTDLISIAFKALCKCLKRCGDLTVSTGFIAVLAALRLCKRVAVYGFGMDPGLGLGANGQVLQHLRGQNLSLIRSECKDGAVYTRYFDDQERRDRGDGNHRPYACANIPESYGSHPHELEHLALEHLHYLGLLTMNEKMARSPTEELPTTGLS